ncbi:hypothetical protein [Rathayibacter sp. VKM Ac-2754]|uniref:hypothetical protein n=1 Tax=Rathayibacter sp. VKM Ac-2754 TaxID=2609251 RepID=UPI00135BB187|nr:hypothetical protein [Rathayibacter sp. VKM Ac-2754]MWV60434.1 hypothetical protein [Rathayibacter sp. VKM Ac-2754]
MSDRGGAVRSRTTTSGARALRPAAWGLALLVAVGGLAGCQGRSGADDGPAAALAPASAVPTQTAVEPTPEAPVAEPSLEPLATPTLRETLPRDYGTGQPVYDLSSDTDAFVYPAAFDESERANADIWIEQQRIIAQCMLDQGFDYTYMLWWERPSGPRSGDDPSEGSLYPAGSPGSVAEWGEQTDGPYDWTTAGCHGYAVHVTGQDDAH